jgi:hypothetical protein
MLLRDSRRQGGFQNLADRRHIILGNPFAEFQDVRHEKGIAVEDFFDGKNFQSVRRLPVESHDEPIDIPIAKCDEDTASESDGRFQFIEKCSR